MRRAAAKARAVPKARKAMGPVRLQAIGASRPPAQSLALAEEAGAGQAVASASMLMLLVALSSLSSVPTLEAGEGPQNDSDLASEVVDG